MKIILYWISWKHKGRMEKNKWHLGEITFLTVLDNFVPLTNNAFKISKEAQGCECVHPLIKVTFSAGFFFYPNNLWFTEHWIKCYILAKTQEF